MTQAELHEAMQKHDLWLRDDPGGKCADLTGADLTGTDLSEADLCHATLPGANLER